MRRRSSRRRRHADADGQNQPSCLFCLKSCESSSEVYGKLDCGFWKLPSTRIWNEGDRINMRLESECKLLDNEVRIMFIVRKLLSIPEATCATMLEKFGSPSEWISVCLECEGVVRKAADLNRKIVKMEKMFEVVRGDAKSRIFKSSATNVACKFRGKISGATEEIRNDITKAQELFNSKKMQPLDLQPLEIKHEQEDWVDNGEDNWSDPDYIPEHQNQSDNEMSELGAQPDVPDEPAPNKKLNARKGLRFDSKQTRKRHPRYKSKRGDEVDRNPIHKCHLCNFTNTQSYNLYRHLRDIHWEVTSAMKQSKKRTKCEKCGKVLMDFKERKVHMVEDHKMVQCPDCPKILGTISKLRAHYKRFHRKPTEVVQDTIPTRIENNGTSTSPTVRKDSIISQLESDTVFKCHRCYLSFPQKCNLLRHIRTIHGEITSDMKIKTGRIKCHQCDRDFGSLTDLNDHLVEAHQMIKCNNCANLFATGTRFRAHVKRYHSLSSQLRQRRRTEHVPISQSKGGRDDAEIKAVSMFKCHRCSYCSEDKLKYYYHLKKVHWETCRTFKTVKRAKKCTYCGQILKNWLAFKDHCKSFHGMTQCKRCPRLFAEVQAQQIHERRIHGIINMEKVSEVCGTFNTREKDVGMNQAVERIDFIGSKCNEKINGDMEEMRNDITKERQKEEIQPLDLPPLGIKHEDEEEDSVDDGEDNRSDPDYFPDDQNPNDNEMSELCAQPDLPDESAPNKKLNARKGIHFDSKRTRKTSEVLQNAMPTSIDLSETASSTAIRKDSSQPESVTTFKCHRCHLSFTQTYNLLRHIRTIHGEITPNMKIKTGALKIKCDQCDRDFGSLTDLNDHRVEAHQMIKCNHCANLFATEARIRAHVKRYHSLSSQSRQKRRKGHVPISQSTGGRDDTERNAVSMFKCHRCSYCSEDKLKYYYHLKKVHWETCSTFFKTHKRTKKCTHCGKMLDNLAAFIDHCKTDHGMIQCTRCPRLFADIESQQSHEKRTHETINVHCVQVESEICDTSNISEEVAGMSQPVGFIDSVVCERCNDVFSSSDDLNEHKVNIHGMVKCPKCINAKFYPTLGYLERHKRLHHSNESSVPRRKSGAISSASANILNRCKICFEAFQNYAQLRAHQIKVHPDKMFACDKCPKMFTYESCLYAHKAEKHKGSRNLFKCDVCSYTNTNFFEVKRHKKVHKVREKANLICELCSATYTSERFLIFHKIKAHGHVDDSSGYNVDDFHCKLCSRTFSTPFYLRTHVRTVHERVFIYKCQVCERGFRCQKAVDDHVRIVHQNILPFKCTWDGCHKQFGRNCELNTHVRRMHKKEKRLNCSYCPKAFFERNALKRHEEIHSNEGTTPYQCDHCGKGFTVRGYLLQHLRSHKKEANEMPNPEPEPNHV